MNFHLFLSGLLLLLCFDASVSNSTSTVVPTYDCDCLGEPYMKYEEPFKHDDCTYCVNCGEVQPVDCIDSCVNPEPEVENDGVCCPVCPNGPNCEKDGEIIPHGELVEVGDELCECEPLVFGFYDPRKSVICYPLPPAGF